MIRRPVARQIDLDWNQFANRLGQRELPRLDYLRAACTTDCRHPALSFAMDKCTPTSPSPG